MDRNDFERLTRLIGPERNDRILKKMAREARVSGWRVGKVPVPILQNLINKSGTPQQHFMRLVIKEFFPDVDTLTIDPSKLPDDFETIPGKIAAFSLRGKEEQIVWPHAENDVSREQVETIKECENTTPDVDEATELIITENSDTNIKAETLVDNEDTSSNVAITTKETRLERRTRTMATRYIGYVQVKVNSYKNAFYNFHPIAELNDNGIYVLDSEERKRLFPTYGNINIYSEYRNEERLEDYFGNGGIYVFNIDPDTFEENLKYGELNKTNYKVNFATLQDNMSIRTPNELGLFAVANVSDLDAILKEQKTFELPLEAVVSPDLEQVLLRANGQLAGPFPVFEESGVQYVNPKSRSFVYNLYDEPENVEAYVTIRYPGGAYGSRAVDCTYVNLYNLTSNEIDFITDEELINQFEKVLEQRSLTDTGADKVIASAFVGTDLPGFISDQRRERMLTLISQQKNLEGVTSQIAQLIDKLIIDAAGNDSDQFEQFFGRLASDPDFLNSFQKHRIIKRAISDAEAQLEEKKKALEEQQARFSEIQQQLENARIGELSEEIESKQQYIEQLNQEYSNLSERLGLVKGIDDLRVEHRVEQRRLQDIQAQTKGLLDAFRAGTNDALEKIAQVVLDEPVAEIIADIMKKNKAGGIEKGKKQLYEKAKSYADLCVKEFTDDTDMIKALCDRVQKYRQYSYNDIINLYMCIIQGRLSVFAGAPGTGKTSICLILAHALGLDSIQELGNEKNLENRFVVVPVERGWSSKRDFIGYFNPLTKTFDKNNRKVYSALELTDQENAFEDRTIVPPYLITLDEANLSPMEYYWADFMASHESTVPVTIDLGDDAQFTVSDSLKFLATINNDHTTESLSPRLIDRAWVISLPQPVNPIEICFDDKYAPVSLKDLLRVFNTSESNTNELNPEAETLLKRIYDFCKERLGISISPRVMIAIKKYCIVGERLFETTGTQDVSAIVAVDYAVAQRILPKIQGNGLRYQNELKEFSKELRANNLRKSADILMRIIQTGDNNMNYYQYFA